MEANETIIEVELDMEEDQLATLSNEGCQAEWSRGKFFQRALVESDICLCHVKCEKNIKRQHVQRLLIRLGKFSP